MRHHAIGSGLAGVLLMVGGLGAAGLSLASSRESSRMVAPVEAQVFRVEGADGPPDLSCDAARAAAHPDLMKSPSNAPPPKPKAPPTEKGPEPDLEQMPALVLDGKELSTTDLPGWDLASLPPQHLEGPASAIRDIGEVMRAADLGARVRITVFGASHVGGDFWTGQIRRDLQARYGDLGHGFVLPAALFEGWRGNDINLCRTDDWFPDYAGKRDGRDDGLLGFAGMSVSSKNDASFGWIETTRTNPLGRSVSSYDVYALGQPGGGHLELTVDAAGPRTVSTDAAAPTLLRWRLNVGDGPHRLTLSPLGDGEVRVFGVSAEREGSGVIVDAMGVRGKTARSQLSWDRQMAASGLLALNPDMVVLAYGTNEAADVSYTFEQYRSDLREVLREVRRVVPDVACALVGPSDRAVEQRSGGWRVWDRTAGIAQVQREVAPEFNCAFWDMQQATGGPGSMVAWRLMKPTMAAGDLIHFSAAGYALLGDRFVAALDEARASAR